MSSIRKLLRSAVRAGQAPGLVAMAANSDGVVYSGAYGHRCIGEPGRMTYDTVFRLSWLLRPLASIAAIQLAGSGALDLDDRLAEPAGSRLHPDTQPSLRQLLARVIDPNVAADDTDIARTVVAVERASGMRLDTYIQRNLLEPLDMRDTHFLLPASRWKRMAGMHSEVAPGVLESTSFSTTDAQGNRPSRTALYSTPQDSLQFFSALLRRDPRLLSEQGYHELARTRLPDRNPCDVHIYRGLFNTFCWLDRSSDTTGLLFTQVLPREYRPLSTLFTSYRKAITSANTKEVASSRSERLLEYFSWFGEERVWWI
jgi:CubicO group peptidase (beta-lactamase class C family)